MKNTLYIAAALLLDPLGQTLLVRKRGTEAFMQPGGKIEAGEPPVVALVRELDEELGLRIDTAQALYLGRFSAPAANEAGFEVVCELFQVLTEQTVVVAAEIEEAHWGDAASHGRRCLAPLTRDHVLPIYVQGRG